MWATGSVLGTRIRSIIAACTVLGNTVDRIALHAALVDLFWLVRETSEARIEALGGHEYEDQGVGKRTPGREYNGFAQKLSERLCLCGGQTWRPEEYTARETGWQNGGTYW